MHLRYLAAAVLVATAGPALSQSAERIDSYELSAIVESVDAETRQVLLRDDATGELEVIVAGPEVRNFDQIEAGDRVKAVYTLGVAAAMAEPGETGAAGAVVSGSAAEGETPAAVAGAVVSVVVELMSWDDAASVAVVRADDGAVRRIAVEREQGRAFARQLAPGDRIALTFTESIAIGLVEQ